MERLIEHRRTYLRELETGGNQCLSEQSAVASRNTPALPASLGAFLLQAAAELI